jgi:formate-dependent nitrite reductase cytochrome c552 subunit
MNVRSKESIVLTGTCVVFLGLSLAFLANLWGHTPPLADIPIVADTFTNTATARMSGQALIDADEDASGYQCYACHEEGKELKLTFNDKGEVVLPEDHNDLHMAHGRHSRNNNCFNCHDEKNLRLLQTKDGRQVELLHSSPLCGSCHGPTYRDWEAGAHGRISGKWTHEKGQFVRKDCVQCHNPHAPTFRQWKPAPGPHPLRPAVNYHAETSTEP